eukprot:SAG31_NODE_4882_length_2886_cov_9.714029_1_plen_136_part_00
MWLRAGAAAATCRSPQTRMGVLRVAWRGRLVPRASAPPAAATSRLFASAADGKQSLSDEVRCLSRTLQIWDTSDFPMISNISGAPVLQFGTPQESALYCLGVSVGQHVGKQLEALQLKESEVELVLVGLQGEQRM